MSKREIMSNPFEERVDCFFFKEQLTYHLHGAHRCMSLMKGHDFDQISLDKELLGLLNDLQTRLSLRGEGYQERETGKILSTKEKARMEGLKEELRVSQRSNRGLRKSNLRLKKANKILNTSLRQLKFAFSRYLKQEQSNVINDDRSTVSAQDIKSMTKISQKKPKIIKKGDQKAKTQSQKENIDKKRIEQKLLH